MRLETWAFELEEMWIADLNLQDRRIGYNMTAGGEGLKDPTGEIGRKISKSKRGVKPVGSALEKTMANLEKAREACCGRRTGSWLKQTLAMSRIGRAKAKEANTGRKHTGERLEKTRVAQKIATAKSAEVNRGRANPKAAVKGRIRWQDPVYRAMMADANRIARLRKLYADTT